jgi:uncharacterized coiled-coil DUF342 family protein
MEAASERIMELMAERTRLETHAQEAEAARDMLDQRVRDLEAQVQHSASIDASILQTVTKTVDEVWGGDID